MSNVKFTKQELNKFISYYSKERERLQEKLEIVNSMLFKLDGEVTDVASEKDQVKPSGKLTSKGEKPKKRGPKSIWGKFIIGRLRARQKPMSYDDLIADAMSIQKISENRQSNARASILNAAFRLRTVTGQIVTVGRKGRKEKLIVRTSWLNEDGSLKDEYSRAFKIIKGGKAEKVDMSTIPDYQYD